MVLESVNKEKKKKSNTKNVESRPAVSDDDFYGNLRDMYNKPYKSTDKSYDEVPAEGSSKTREKHVWSEPKNPEDILRDIDILTANVKEYLNRPLEMSNTKNKASKNDNKIKYSRSRCEEVGCKTVRYEEPTLYEHASNINMPELWRKLGSIDDEGNDPDDLDKFPRLEDLPDDPDELEKTFRKYVDRLNYILDDLPGGGDAKKDAKERAEGGETSRDFAYRLGEIISPSDPTQAVTGVRKCECPDRIVIEGETADLRDIKMSVKELKSNHNVGAVEVKMKPGEYKIDESVDSSDKMSDYKGHALLTKYTLETLCSQISKHPCLSRLAFDYVPMPSTVQALLVPAFANLSHLRLVGAKLEDEGVEKLCKFLWKSKNLIVIDFTDNGITKKGVERIARLVENKGFYKVMESDFCAIERLTLNKNPIGSDGLKILLKTLQTDLFMKAVDLRECDIEATSKEVLDMIGNNTDLHVLDLRGNMVQRLDLIIKSILLNGPNEEKVYKWDDEEEIMKYRRSM